MIFISDFGHVTGALAGLAIGDALGAPFEGAPPPDRPVTGFSGGGPRMRVRGQFTDDTLQALAVATSLTHCRGYCPEDMAWRLLAGYRRYPEFYGPTSGSVFDLIARGIPPYQAAFIVHRANRGSRSNGSVMRGFPIGIFFAGPEVGPVSACASRLTHFDPLPGACSAWLNRMVSALCRGASREQAFVSAWRLCGDEEVAERLGRYRKFDPEPGLDALLCSHAALSIFMEHRSFPAAVTAAVSMGGDADTVGACTGALAGACFGIGAVPPVWLAGLRGAGTVIDTAVRLWAVSQ
ncbi:MAG: ADP-ribosylglycohydrolase family protein [Methanoregulaceae archaeon]|nr:ADP-ribosylglycohydrolase family protein [Methanoregulaceae archaeon]